MRAFRVADQVRPSTVIQADVPRPRPLRGELLIHVRAAGVTVTELSWYPTSHTEEGGLRVWAVPAHEFSGVVADVGDDVGSLEIGRAVYGMNGWYSDGAMAEYCIAPFYAVAPKPGRLTDAEAATVPISALTAWQGLFDHAKLQPGERVLVHGGAGGVGVFAIQLARLHGAHVIATASARNREFVSSLGAELVIDYRTSRFEEFATGIDVVFDTVGGETLERSWDVLDPHGRMVTIAATAEGSADPRVEQAFFIVEPNQKQLYEIAGMLDAGSLRPVVDTVIPLSHAPDIFSGKVQRQGRGKLVIANSNNS